ncbi:MAG: hypothetical protein ACO2ZM_00605 [Francisellaceae bacterium]
MMKKIDRRTNQKQSGFALWWVLVMLVIFSMASLLYFKDRHYQQKDVLYTMLSADIIQYTEATRIAADERIEKSDQVFHGFSWIDNINSTISSVLPKSNRDLFRAEDSIIRIVYESEDIIHINIHFPIHGSELQANKVLQQLQKNNVSDDINYSLSKDNAYGIDTAITISRKQILPELFERNGNQKMQGALSFSDDNDISHRLLYPASLNFSSQNVATIDGKNQQLNLTALNISLQGSDVDLAVDDKGIDLKSETIKLGVDDNAIRLKEDGIMIGNKNTMMPSSQLTLVNSKNNVGGERDKLKLTAQQNLSINANQISLHGNLELGYEHSNIDFQLAQDAKLEGKVVFVSEGDQTVYLGNPDITNVEAQSLIIQHENQTFDANEILY